MGQTGGRPLSLSTMLPHFLYIGAHSVWVFKRKCLVGREKGEPSRQLIPYNLFQPYIRWPCGCILAKQCSLPVGGLVSCDQPQIPDRDMAPVTARLVTLNRLHQSKLTLVIRHWTITIRHWTLDIRHWALDIGYGTLDIGR